MKFEEFGLENEKTLMLLPGTGCTCQINFGGVKEELEKKYHLICVNYDGFDGDKTVSFPGMISVTKKIEKYIQKNHGGKVDGAYGSSLGGSFVGLLIQRKNIHIDHGFIGSSDLDQGSPFAAKIATRIIGGTLQGSLHDPGKRKRLFKLFEWVLGLKADDKVREFAEQYISAMEDYHPDAIMREYYSDYVTPLENGIDVPGTTIHVIYALKMGKKYEKRYLQHFANPDIIRFDMAHEVWMFDDKWRKPVMDAIETRMEGDNER
ncbi:MAG: alpha/beta hydrolase [Lachnospiraceae bacterium]|nr:alpha/beta hydrolase [Lachnospiraceae bacterium]